MPYLLTANPPGSPNSWVKMETDSQHGQQTAGSSSQDNSNATASTGSPGDQVPVPPPPTRPRALPPPLNGNFGTISKYSNYVNSSVNSTPHLPTLLGSTPQNNSHVLGSGGTVPNFGIFNPASPSSTTNAAAGFGNYSLSRNHHFNNLRTNRSVSYIDKRER